MTVGPIAPLRSLAAEAGITPFYLNGPYRYPLFNPGMAAWENSYVFIARSSNLLNVDEGRYSYDALPHDTRNHLFVTDRDFRLVYDAPVDDKLARSHPAVAGGLEDCRLFIWNDRLWGLAAGIARDEAGRMASVSQTLVRFDGARIDAAFLLHSPTGRHWEKNWSPLVRRGRLYFAYDIARGLVFALSKTGLRRVRGSPDPPADFAVSGGTPLVPWRGGYLSLAHLKRTRVAGRFHYRHVFVRWNRTLSASTVSEPFILNHEGVEFACGLAHHPGGLLVSFGEADRRAAFMVLPEALVARWTG